MATLERHMAQYRAFKETAELRQATPQSRVELLFLAAYHLIDACTARKGQHINKHQMVRHELEMNPSILGERTDEVWRSFQELQGPCRAKFVYGGQWTGRDLRVALGLFTTIERRCLEVLE